MVKKKEKTLKKLPKLPKIAWWGLWFVGIFASLFIILYASAQIWVSTWQTYRNDEFGFSFRYPKSWYIVNKNNIPITKAQIDQYSWAGFYIDSKSELPNDPQDPIRSLGDVRVWIEKTSSIMDAHKLQANYLKPKEVKYGSYIGLTSSGEGGMCSEVKSFWRNRLYQNSCALKTLTLSKSFDLKTSSYYFYVNSLSYTDDMDLFSQTKARFYYLVGSKIVDSFTFIK